MSVLQNILKACTKKELEDIYNDAKTDKSFRGGMLLSACSREIDRRKYKEKNKKEIK